MRLLINMNWSKFISILHNKNTYCHSYILKNNFWQQYCTMLTAGDIVLLSHTFSMLWIKHSRQNWFSLQYSASESLSIPGNCFPRSHTCGTICKIPSYYRIYSLQVSRWCKPYLNQKKIKISSWSTHKRSLKTIHIFLNLYWN